MKRTVICVFTVLTIISLWSHLYVFLSATTLSSPLNNKQDPKIFYMIKTGGTELWNKLPIHLYITLPYIQNYAIYSDSPAVIKNHNVINILDQVSNELKQTNHFEQYRLHQQVVSTGGIYDYSEALMNKGWELDKFKNILILHDAYKKCPTCDWFFMMDADTYIMKKSLLEWVRLNNPDEPHYYGSVIGAGVLFAHGGSGILVSRKAVELSLNSSELDYKVYEDKTKSSCCGDAMLAVMLKEQAGVDVELASNKPFQGNTFWDVEVTKDNWGSKVLTFHHTTPHDQQVLWEFEIENDEPSYGDVYQKFYKHMIDSEIQNWDNNARSKQFEKDKDIRSIDDCRLNCTNDGKCLTWRYLPNEEYCGIGYSVRLGKPVLDHFKFEYDQDKRVKNNTNATSGWMMDRISTFAPINIKKNYK